MPQQMYRVLNWNDNFEMNDLFQLYFTHVGSALRGSGKRRKLKPGPSNHATFKRFEKSVIEIENRDELRCARVLATAKAYVNRRPKWSSFTIEEPFRTIMPFSCMWKQMCQKDHPVTKNVPNLH